MLSIPTAMAPTTLPGFVFAGRAVSHFLHRHNVFHPPFRMTERSVELALADQFLSQYGRGEVIEVGAVTPYYWPHRVAEVFDPADKHELVTGHCTWDEVDPRGRAVLSISTFEHIGLPDYGLPPDTAASGQAVDKLVDCSSDFLVTFPGGYNPSLDDWVMQRAAEGGFELHFLERSQVDNDWQQRPWQGLGGRRLVYGPYWANALFVMHRGRF